MFTQSSKDSSILEYNKEMYFRPGENVYIHMSNITPEYNGCFHKHKFIEIVYVISGKATHVIGNNNYVVSRGDVFIINYDMPHAFFVNFDYHEPFSTYDLLFTPDFFDLTQIGNGFETLASSFLFYSLFPLDASIVSDLKLINSSYSEFHNIFNKIYMEYNDQKKGYINLIRVYIVELVTKIFRRLEESSQSAIPVKQRQLIDRAISYLKENYNTQIDMNHIMADLFLSKNYFRHLFKNTTGLSITEFQQKIRIEEACNLLATTDRTVSDISKECGFNDEKFFYSTFKKIMGKTPSEYRKTCSLALMITYSLFKILLSFFSFIWLI